jgi:hypothetical protein
MDRFNFSKCRRMLGSMCYSCGYLVGETDREYKVCSSYGERGEEDITAIGYVAIPKVAVISIRKL